MLVALKKAGCFQVLVGSTLADSLLGAGVLGHSLGALRHGVLGQLTGQDEADRGLDLPGGDRRLLVVAGQVGGLGGDLKGRWRGEEVSREGGGRHSNVLRAHPCPSHTPSRRCR